MEKKNRRLAGVMAAALAIALAVPVSAMPGDIREAKERAAAEAAQPKVTVQNENNYLEPVEEYYVATGAGNVRETPNGEIIDVLEPGERYYVIAYRIDCGWYKLKGYSGTAYVYQDFLSPREEYGGEEEEQEEKEEHLFRRLDILMKATADVNMRTEPGGRVVGVLKKGTDIRVTGNLDDIYWYQCETDKGDTVYIYDDYLVPDFPQTMQATHVLNVREQPSTSTKVVHLLQIGDKVKVSAIEDGWYKFTYNDKGDVGYSHSDYMSVVE